MTATRRKRHRFLPELAVAGALLVSGAWIWSSTFGLDAQAADAQTVAGKAPGAPIKPATWKAATAAQRTGAAQAIRAQLELFKKDEWQKAVGYQSSNLKRHFPSTAAFRAAIVGNYPEFAKYKSIQFGNARATGPIVQLAVKLTGQDNVVVSAVYIMVKEKDGYKVEGVSGGVAPHVPDGEPA